MLYLRQHENLRRIGLSERAKPPDRRAAADNWSSFWKKHHLWIGAAVSGALIAMCYGFALQLPFFFDDLPIVTWLSRHTWADIWLHSSENAYYRPLAFTIYKFALFLPVGTQQVILHLAALLVQWTTTLLIVRVVQACGHNSKWTVLAAVLLAVHPFLFLALPWITALPHLLVTLLTCLAVYAALRAKDSGSARWWAASLTAIALAPLAHESGAVCGLIVGGFVLIQHGLRGSRRRVGFVLLGVTLNVGAVLLRSIIPGVGATQWPGLRSLVENAMFFLHGLVYPVAPLIGRLALQHGWHDFTLVGVATALLLLTLVWLARRSGDWRWMAQGLWWWGWGALPAAVSFKYGDLFVAPRLHALSSVGVVILWAGIIVELGKQVRHTWGRWLVWSALSGAIVLQNVAFLNHQRALFTTLNRAYQQVLDAAGAEQNVPLGLVNLPAWLAYPSRTYALVTEGVEFLPPYSNIGEFIQVNLGWRPADGVMFTPVLRETEQVFGFRGAGLSWEEMRQFAIDHRSVWLAVYQDRQFLLKLVGAVTPAAAPSAEALVRFEGGPVIEAANVKEHRRDEWVVTLTWLAAGPVDGEIFVHVRDAAGNVVAQADGPALGGMTPIWLWQPGDRLTDVRYLILPGGSGPYTVQVGVYNAAGRFPAYVSDIHGLLRAHAPDDAAPVATILP